ncbi:hypothetical protein OTK49_21330 [Vibrio coralliirubri]|uniref:hypothetical protein n=1 Tax=Vibrio coralliirubri TaxID=1516159 RepID=UPI002283BF86|nr:hypothetical protein [Vibrio coralliirubri]MCY9865064.1 hypothetical protein [Vibrio coralliirubri]
MDDIDTMTMLATTLETIVNSDGLGKVLLFGLACFIIGFITCYLMVYSVFKLVNAAKS